jgi:biofilm PGA synthesis lipoprotein PgaB
MPIAFSLDDGLNTPDVPLTALRRTMILHNPGLAGFVGVIMGPLRPEPIRAVQVDLGDVYSPDPAQQERNLSLLLDRIKVLMPSHVLLQATADTGGDGKAVAAYFPTPYLPLRADLFNRVAWQLVTRDRVKVFAVLPVEVSGLPQESVAGIYGDLARHAYFDGLVFDDKHRTGEFDDAHTLQFTLLLARDVRAFRAPQKTMRVLRTDPALAAAPSPRLAEGFSSYLAAYDFTGLAAKPAGGKVDGQDFWLNALSGNHVDWRGDPVIQRKLVVMFANAEPQPGDQKQAPEALPGSLLAARMRTLQLQGVLNFGYMPDDFAHDRPPLAQIAPALSLRIYPLIPGGTGK